MYSKLVLAVLCAISVHIVAAQTTTVSGGNWSDVSNWSNGVPAAVTTTTVNSPMVLDADLTISGSYTFSQSVTDLTGGSNHSLTLTGTLDVTAGTTTFEGNGNINNGSTLIVRNGATLILGNTSVGNNVTLLVESGGTLIINGSLSNGNNTGTFTIGGLVYVNGNFNNSGTADLVGTGDIITTNALNNGGASTTFGTGNDCSTGPCSGRNLCGFTNSVTANQTLCSGSSPTALAGSAVTSPTYVWESSTTSSTSGFAVAAGTSNGQNYTPSSLTQTTWYRRKATSNGCTGISVPVQISVVPSAGGWRGTTSDWNTASNWCNNTVPTATTDVTISTGVANMPQMTATSNAHNLTINSGATVSVNGTNTFNIFGNLFNNGTFNTNNSTVVFQGSSQQTISGNPMTFYNLTVNSASASTPQLYVNAFITIQNNFNLTAGVINLSGYNLTLGTNAGSTGTLNYTNGWMDNGGFTRWVSTPSISDGNSRGLFPMGGASDKRRLFVSFPTTNPTSMGTIKVTHFDNTSTSTVSVIDGASTITRRNDSYWTIGTGNGLAGGTYNIRAGGTGFGTVGALTDLRLMRAGDVVGTNGGTAGGSTTTDFLAVRTGLSVAQLASSFYVGSINPTQTPLPVELISFTGQNTAEGVLLKWSTSMEKNFDRFEIERSSDGISFDYVSSVKGKGGVALRTEYMLVDGSARNGKYYYRLKNVDLDNTYDYSKVIVVLVGDGGTIALYPNPVRDKKLSVVIPQQYSAARILINDQMGNAVYQADLSQGEQSVQLAESLRQGFYIARVLVPGEVPKTIKLWIE
jgi:hypothetical protein